MYRIAIVDDEMDGEIGRRSFYQNLFGKRFDIVKFVSTPEEIEELPKLEVHAYIVDLVYSGMQYKGITFDSIISSINAVKSVPIILISSKWETFKTPSIIGKLCKFNNIVMCLGWDDVSSSAGSTNGDGFILNQISTEIGKFYKYTDAVKNDNDKIIILHLSDIQFGDKSTDPSSFLSKYDIVTYLNDVNKIPDIIVVTGDIASHGLWEEYLKAYEWLEDFCMNIWNDNVNWGERVVIVPGNHDVDYLVCLPDEYEWNFSDVNFMTQKSVVKKTSTDLYHKKAMIDFARFMRMVTGDMSYLDEYDDLFKVNEKFLNWGIRFYELNTAQDISPYAPRQIEIRTNNFDKLKKNTLKFESKDIFNIVVSHFGPEDIGYRQSDSEKAKKWDIMRAFIESAKVNMYMSGHVHRSEIRRLEDNGPGAHFSKNIIVSTASTCSLSADGRPPEEYRGFNVLELQRENGVVNKVSGYEYRFIGASIEAPQMDDVFREDNIKYNYIPMSRFSTN